MTCPGGPVALYVSSNVRPTASWWQVTVSSIHPPARHCAADRTWVGMMTQYSKCDGWLPAVQGWAFMQGGQGLS